MREGAGSSNYHPPSRQIHWPSISLKDLAYLIGGIIWIVSSVVGWFQNRASKQDVIDGDKASVATCASAIASSIAPITSAMLYEHKRLDKQDDRWNALDKAISKNKTLNPKGAPTFPKFGPEAEKHGEISTEE